MNAELHFLMASGNENYDFNEFWSVLQGFDQEIWILYILTPFIIALISLVLRKKSAPYNFSFFHKTQEILWQTFSSIFLKSEMQMQKFSERILFLSFWFIIIMLGMLYIGTLTIKTSFSKTNTVGSI